VTIDPSATNHPLSYWDDNAGQWTIADGNYQVYVGSSAAAPRALSIRPARAMTRHGALSHRRAGFHCNTRVDSRSQQRKLVAPRARS